MKRAAVAIAALLSGLAASGLQAATDGGGYPPLKDGDLVFQTSTSAQSNAIFAATASPYTHMGIVKNEGGKLSVIEAGPTVREVPLKTWVSKGRMAQVAIYRDPALTPPQTARILYAARPPLRHFFLVPQRRHLLQRTTLPRLQGRRYSHRQGAKNLRSAS